MTDSTLAPDILRAVGAALVASEDMALILAGDGGTIAFANPCAQRALGAHAGSLAGARLDSMIVAGDAPRLARLLAGPGGGPPELLRFTDDGTAAVQALVVSAVPLGPGAGGAVLLLGRDAGAEIVREARVRAAQRFEVVGQLATGIAHELNNALSTVTTFSDLLLAGAEPASGAAEDLREIKQAALDAAAILRKLDLFAGGSAAGATAETSVPEVVRGMRKLLARFLTKSVALTVEADDATPPVPVAPIHIEEILVALAANARDALGDGGAVTLTVRPGGTAEAPTALLELADTGRGPRPPEADRAVEAFFSSKPLTVGTGLGLATVARIVQEHGGTFRIAARPEGGVLASVELPACSDPSTPKEGERP